jgi:hypothetical protein
MCRRHFCVRATIVLFGEVALALKKLAELTVMTWCAPNLRAGLDSKANVWPLDLKDQTRAIEKAIFKASVV